MAFGNSENVNMKVLQLALHHIKGCLCHVLQVHILEIILDMLIFLLCQEVA
jgi:hypothetical protein